MRFEWDEAKRATNLQRHAIDFVGLETVFDGPTITVEDERWGYGEQRLVTFGLLEGRVVAVVHTERAEVIRIISARKATRREESSYFSNLPD